MSTTKMCEQRRQANLRRHSASSSRYACSDVRYDRSSKNQMPPVATMKNAEMAAAPYRPCPAAFKNPIPTKQNRMIGKTDRDGRCGGRAAMAAPDVVMPLVCVAAASSLVPGE
ncbi:hypothetical protein C8K11_12059 [Novosphingobium sp. GV055]|nr:hypothetical protein C8K11_12059 [Novosphingobium sp. GV055]PUA94865.1 hypothetical protein C8K12_12059 [Novosphingobium sp. GV061]PUB13790.1 hypothetical protein C8K14_12059 [Novosphingobium sp. GV079]PUB38488.1 hypothetical protein C8K10_12059 [Novosphingobium sp. GV027]